MGAGQNRRGPWVAILHGLPAAPGVECSVFRLQTTAGMEPELSRSSLNGSPLVALLAELALIDGPAAAPSFVQGLGRWLGWEDAINLSAALQTPVSSSPGALNPARARKQVLQLQAEGEHLRTSLTRTLEEDGSQAGGTEFAHYRRHYSNYQQAMADTVGPLRSQARAAVALVSSALQRLAAMDAVMERAVGSHEQALLAQLPTLLERHFTRLRRLHENTPAPSGNTAWLATFRQDMRRIGRAELALRLLPLQGLLDTLQTLTKQPMQPMQQTQAIKDS
jgi:hypothetical protein